MTQLRSLIISRGHEALAPHGWCMSVSASFYVPRLQGQYFVLTFSSSLLPCLYYFFAVDCAPYHTNRQSQYDHSNEGIPLSRKLPLFRHLTRVRPWNWALGVRAAGPQWARYAQRSESFRAFGMRPVPALIDEPSWFVHQYNPQGRYKAR
ncbi:hypothetical protein BJV77DRAFT_164806 [Russula vinacea]|nr:hypothetical protein BJV77DRAFT_164806 [Russula vinacea]